MISNIQLYGDNGNKSVCTIVVSHSG